MRIVQRVLLYVVSFFLILAGIAIAMYPYNPQVAEFAQTIASKPMNCLFVGIVIAALGLFTVIPFDLFRRKGRSISFAGPTGTVSIQIDSFETSLRKTIAKLPMVKRVNVHVTPKDNDRKVGVKADVSLKKPAETSTRETAERLREFIDKVSRQILGADEVISVDVNVEDVLIDPSQTAESLNSIFSRAEESVVPAQRTVTPYVAPTVAAATAAATASMAGAPMASEPLREVDEEVTDGTSAELEADIDEAKSASPSSELLTYDEAQELKHTRMTDTAAVSDDFESDDPVIDADVATEDTDDSRALPAFDDDQKETSFQSLADGKENSEADGEPNPDSKF